MNGLQLALIIIAVCLLAAAWAVLARDAHRASHMDTASLPNRQTDA